MANTDNRKTAPEPDEVEAKSARVPLMELKNGRAVLRQKLVAFERMTETMQELVAFREFLETQMAHRSEPLDRIPDEHLPLIAKLVHESDKTLAALSKHIHATIHPEPPAVQDDAESSRSSEQGVQLPVVVIEKAVSSIADRVNYGVDWLDKVPAALCIWRWELQEQRKDWLPKSGMEKFTARRAERQQARDDLRRLIDALPETDRVVLLKLSKKSKNDKVADFIVVKGGPKSGNKPVVDDVKDSIKTESENSTPKAGRPKKPVDPERVAKEKERAEKKAAKADKDRKEKDAVNKSRSVMSAFLTKPKPAKPAKGTLAPPSTHVKVKNSGSIYESDFAKTFKSFVVKKDASLAPLNWFRGHRQPKEIIVVDSDPQDAAKTPIEDVDVQEVLPSAADRHDILRRAIADAVKKVPHLCGTARRNISGGPPHLRSSSKYYVRDIMTQLAEAEIVGDTIMVRRLTDLLASRWAIPAKVLIFHEDTRPGYFGTFTKSSSSVGPRTPFAKDAVAFDYSCDSGAEWEEEEEGGDDIVSLDGSAEDDASEVTSDLDDWLVDDDEDVDPGTPLSERAGSLGLSPPPLAAGSSDQAPPKRKPGPSPGEKKTSKKRKVVPLLPFAKGPCLEERIGFCEYEPFAQYRIQLFNDTPYPIDPFAFVSAPVVSDKRSTTNGSLHVFAVPPLPDHIQFTTQAADSQPGSSTMVAVPARRKAAPAAQPKAPFPDALLPTLVGKVNALAAGNLTWLIESVYQEFRALKVTRIAVDAKVREICEKCRIKKVWVVKDDVIDKLNAPAEVVAIQAASCC